MCLGPNTGFQIRWNLLKVSTAVKKPIVPWEGDNAVTAGSMIIWLEKIEKIRCCCGSSIFMMVVVVAGGGSGDDGGGGSGVVTYIHLYLNVVVLPSFWADVSPYRLDSRLGLSIFMATATIMWSTTYHVQHPSRQGSAPSLHSPDPKLNLKWHNPWLTR